jgi:hypothetical protein
MRRMFEQLGEEGRNHAGGESTQSLDEPQHHWLFRQGCENPLRDQAGKESRHKDSNRPGRRTPKHGCRRQKIA